MTKENNDTNLLDETVEYLKQFGKSATDVVFVGQGKHVGSWLDFENLAKNIIYDNGFGGNEISLGLIIVGKNWWLERHEYDGSEWWEYKERPVILTDKIIALTKESIKENNY